ncbi:DUF6082 family protein [Streptomyces sp. Agncl-13]|uniref:DUF6082 family protein n=1 Tax=Streptomyces sp. Agncl-13 TaxID=3400628 RepID=UPI003A86B818
MVALILASPFIMRAIAPAGNNWSELSVISQTYGAVAVFFSGAAFFGAVISILYQAKQTRIMHEEIHSSMHKELILRSLEDDSLMYCWDPPSTPATMTERRQIAFTNLIYRRWLDGFMTGRENLGSIRNILTVHFKGEVARRHWREGGPEWRDYAKESSNRRLQRFIALTNEVYEAALAEGSAVQPESYFLPTGHPGSS